MTKKEMANKRLEKLTKKGLMPFVSEEFRKEGTLYASTQYLSLLCPSNFPEEVNRKIEELNKKYGIIVYHLSHGIYEFGDCWDLWCISEDDLRLGDGEFDNYNIAFAYVMNLTVPAFSEFGSIGFEIKNGVAVRTA